jgi:hypothetical protein
MKTKLQTITEFLQSEHGDFDIAEQVTQAKYDLHYEGDTFDFNAQEYMVLTEEQADEVARGYIENTVWAFVPSFLERHTGIDEGIFEALQDKCESVNDLILNSIKDIEEFVDDAIDEDGRAHFINSYDGNEEEFNDYLIYRMA